MYRLSNLWSLLAMAFLLQACDPEAIRKQWTPVGPAIDFNINSTEFNPTDSSIWIAGGYKFNLGFVGRSDDRGQNWWLDTITDKAIFDLHIFNTQRIITAGYDGQVYQTFDAGQSWERYQLPEFIHCHSIAFNSDGVGLIAGGNVYNSGRLFRSTDSGRSWTAVLDTVYQMRSIFFATDEIVYSGGYGAIFKSMDAGQTWILTKAEGDIFTGMHFFNPDTGLACGLQGSVRLTTDGGESWKVPQRGNKPFVVRRNLTSIQFINQSVGYVCGERGDLYRSDDGGNEWRVITQFTDSWLSDLALINEDELFTGDREGNLFLVRN